MLGSAFDGTEPADGVLDEVFCFAGPLTSREIAFYYNYTAGEAALGPTSAAEDAALAALHTQNGHRTTGFAHNALIYSDSLVQITRCMARMSRLLPVKPGNWNSRQ